MIVIGEQNGARYHLKGEALAAYERLYARHQGEEVMQGSSEYLDNYRRIVHLFGGTFREMGIEILLHDLEGGRDADDPARLSHGGVQSTARILACRADEAGDGPRPWSVRPAGGRQGKCTALCFV
ncbi:MAG TPA: hypothetical protein VMT50_10995 [Steroidobacteraceae bacterium]|nr:hypothetical protein [Steroidobacteraceae bacterium]